MDGTRCRSGSAQPRPRRSRSHSTEPTCRRPNTYQLTVALLAAAGGRIEAVEITALTAGVFYARLALADGSAVDARPSDALNIAVLVDAPVRVDPEVVAAANNSPRRPAPGPSDHPAIAAEAMAALASLAHTADRGSGT
jgi:hypothetical protein